MFVLGFKKIASGLSERAIAEITGAPAMKPFGRPIGKFGRRPRTALMSITRLKDGLR